jgi:probable HAF family extracellular repeat protein
VGLNWKGGNVKGNCLGERSTSRAPSRKCRAPKLIAVSAVVIACIFASVLTVAASAAATASHPRSYSITDLGTLGGSFSAASAINNRGQIVGSSSLSVDTVFHAFLYSHGRMTDLFPGSANSDASDINNRGQIVGTLGSQAFLYSRGQVIQFGLGGANSAAFGINDKGDVVGYASPPGADLDLHAFLYRHGQTIDLTPTLPGGEFGSFSIATDVNDRGAVVGYISPFEIFQQPFLWRKGTLTDLPLVLPGDDIAVPFRINNSGEVVGFSLSFSDFEDHAVLLSHGQLISLGPGVATSLNDRGQVVGNSVVSGTQAAFLYQKGTRIELNSLLPAGSGWILSFASDINDRGQIVGSGIHNGAFHAFLLSPSTNKQ